MLKNFGKQNNNIFLNLNIKTIECKILFSGLQLINYINKSLYDLFPNQLKEKLINNFSNKILYLKQKKSSNKNYKNIKNTNKKSREISLIIQQTENNINYLRILHLKLNLLFNYCIKENIILIGYFIIQNKTIMTIKGKEQEEKIF